MRKVLLVSAIMLCLYGLAVWIAGSEDRECAEMGAGPAYYNGAGEFQGCLEPDQP